VSPARTAGRASRDWLSSWPTGQRWLGRSASRVGAMALALAILPLSGCVFTTRKLPVPQAPQVTQTATAEELVKKLNDHWDGLKTLYAKVDVRLTTQKSKEGTEKDYSSFPGIIMMRKPEMLRVYGRVPFVGSPMFNMASDGKTFTLYVNAKNIAYKGPIVVTHKSANTIENIRPGFFLDALIVRGLAPDDEYMMQTDTDTVVDAKRKYLLLSREYILSVMRQKPGSQERRPIRVIHFHRDDLLPYEQDLYDEQGNLQTEVTYGSYVDFAGSKYPKTVTIKRPQEEFQIVLTVDSVKENLDLKDDQFEIQIPPEVKIQTLQ
jgi:outer membrane lipoprotein-sorting protein